MKLRNRVKIFLVHQWWIYRAKNSGKVCMKHYAWPAGRYKIQLAKCGCSWCPSCFHNYNQCDYSKGLSKMISEVQ